MNNTQKPDIKYIATNEVKSVTKAERAIASETLVAENSGLTWLVPYDLTGV